MPSNQVLGKPRSPKASRFRSQLRTAPASCRQVLEGLHADRVRAALAVTVFPPLVLGAQWMPWICTAFVLLMIACPCALVISTPMTVVSALAAAARMGILIKGGLNFEEGGKVRSLALDKTGMIAQGYQS